MDTKLPQHPRVIVRPLLALTIALLPAIASAQARYSAKQTADIVQLRDSRTDTIVSVMVPLGQAYEMFVAVQPAH